MNRMSRILVCLAATVAASAQPALDTLAGVLPPLVREGTYLVVSDIEAPIDKTVTLEPGVVLLFRDFTGLHVRGTLVGRGSARAPVVFSSEFDSRYNPGAGVANPYDWNGVYIHASAIGTSLSSCAFMYSVYGVKSDTKFIRLEECRFAHNGKVDLEIEGERRRPGAEPYNYMLDVKDATVDGVPVKLLRDPLARKRTVVRIVSLTGAVAAAATGVYFGARTHEAADEVDNVRSDRRTGTSARFDSAVDDWRRNAALTAGGGAAALLGVIVFRWTFTF